MKVQVTRDEGEAETRDQTLISKMYVRSTIKEKVQSH